MSLTNRDILCFGDDWGRHPQTLEHIIRIFARRNRVLWVNSVGHRSPRLNWKDAKRILEKVLMATRPCATSDPNITVLRPLAIPFHRFPSVRRLNTRILRGLLQKRMRGLGFRNVVALTNSPLFHALLKQLRPSVVVYYCLDDYTGFTGSLRGMGGIEMDMLSSSDLAFFVSEELLRSRSLVRGDAHLMSQGVDFLHFGGEDVKPVEWCRALRRPVIGFVGLIEDWIDLDLLAAAAKAKTDWSVVVLGPTAVDLKSFQNLPNLFFPGPVPYAEVPRWLASFDVGVIPFVVNPLTKAANPLKLFEYFSQGLPVVSTPVPEVMRFEPLVTIARTTSEFIRALERAIEENTEELKQKRRKLAQEHSWEELARMQGNFILAAEARKNHASTPQDNAAGKV